MELPKAYNPKDVEDRIYRLWEKSGFFNPDRLPPVSAEQTRNTPLHGAPSRTTRKKTYCIVLPPPNITGSLHMGHALNAVIQDILIRRKIMQGYSALWLPGTDHAGIAAQNVVEKELKKEGLTRFDLGREKFLERMWQWRERYGNIILDQLKKMGASCDWSRQVFTMDKGYAKAVETAFLHYYKKGWIYRAERVVNWCSRCRTSLSDLELEYKEERGKLWFIQYPLAQKSEIRNLKSIVVATTRPETMLGDTAVAVNPKDKRYTHLIGKKVMLPIADREIPIIADKAIDPNFGTGAVKVTPAHDLADYEIGLRHKLASRKVIGEDGKITKEAPPAYQDLSVSEARIKVIDDLQTLGLLEKIEDYSHQVPKCYRCGTTVELLPSLQWFLKMDQLAKMAIKAVKSGKVKFIPKRWEKIYFDWLGNVKDWCVSRQIWWGHRLPVWQCQTGKLNSKCKMQNAKLLRVAKQSSLPGRQFKIQNGYFVSLQKPKKCLICKKCRPRQVDDVLDTWFSSALWPFATLSWPKSSFRKNVKCQMSNVKCGDLEKFYPTQVISTDRGIINLWVARMIFSGLEFMGKEPFRDVYVHATVLTREGKRMSKSLGTGIDPLELIEKYGADATRFGIAWQITELQDIRFVEDNIVMGRKFCNKIWNAARFVMMKTANSKFKAQNAKSQIKMQNLTPADRKIIDRLHRVVAATNRDLERYRFGHAAQKLYRFFWHDFCDIYLEESKKQLADKKQKKQTEEILFHVLLTSLKLLHPFIPFITEEIYQQLPIRPVKSANGRISPKTKSFNGVNNRKRCLMVEAWPA